MLRPKYFVSEVCFGRSLFWNWNFEFGLSRSEILGNVKRTIESSLCGVCVSMSLLFALNGLAHAKPASKTPPLERYTCYQVYAPSLTYTYMGYFTLQAGQKYAWGFGKAKPTGRGRYWFDSKGIRFIGGPLKGVTGKFETKKDGRHLLELTIQGKKQYASDDGKITWYCNCDPHDPYNKKRKS